MDADVNVVVCLIIMARCFLPVISKNETASYLTLSRLVIVPYKTVPMAFQNEVLQTVYFNYSFVKYNVTVAQKKGWIISAFMDNDRVAKISGKNVFYILETNPSGNLSLVVEGVLAGRSKLHFEVKDWLLKSREKSSAEIISDSDVTMADISFPVFVIMQQRPIDRLFNGVVFLLIVTANTGMGTQVDLNIVKMEFMHPSGVCIGMLSQVCFMPLIAYFLAIVLKAEHGIALGLFAAGCAPGGISSNVFTFMLGGNVNLSITMTLISTLASLGTLPLWFFILGKNIHKESDIQVPFKNIFIALLLIILPTVIGLIMQLKCKKAADLLIRSIKYIMAAFILFICTVGVYANLYILYIVNTEVIVGSSALPYIGFVLGGFAAFVARQNMSNIIAIAIETGVQNTAIPVVLLRISLTGPEQATSVVIPIMASFTTPLPLFIAVAYKEGRNYYLNKKQKLSTVFAPAPEDPPLSDKSETDDSPETTAV